MSITTSFTIGTNPIVSWTLGAMTWLYGITILVNLAPTLGADFFNWLDGLGVNSWHWLSFQDLWQEVSASITIARTFQRSTLDAMAHFTHRMRVLVYTHWLFLGSEYTGS
jgi:hypothetical protein